MSNTDENIEQGYRKLGRHLIFLTIWDARAIAQLKEKKTTTRTTKDRADARYRYRLGLHSKRITVDEHWLAKKRTELDEWIGSDDFFVIAKKLGFEPNWLKEQIREIANGAPVTPEFEGLIKESCSNYARRRTVISTGISTGAGREAEEDAKESRAQA